MAGVVGGIAYTEASMLEAIVRKAVVSDDIALLGGNIVSEVPDVITVGPGGGPSYEKAGKTVCSTFCNSPELQTISEAFEIGSDTAKTVAFNDAVTSLRVRGVNVLWAEPGSVQRVTGSPRNYATVQGNTIYIDK